MEETKLEGYIKSSPIPLDLEGIENYFISNEILYLQNF